MSCNAVSGTSRGTNVDCAGSTPARQAEGAAPRTLLPDPFTELAHNGDVGAQIAALLVKTAQQQKEAARGAREAAEQAQRAADDEELSAMESQADCKLLAGVIEGAANIGGGAVGIGSAAGSPEARERGRGIASVAQGAGKIAGAVGAHHADMHGLDAKSAEQTSGRERRAAEDARDLGKDAADLLDRALGYYKEYMTAKSDVQRATLLRA